jgi:hypothetical protein
MTAQTTFRFRTGAMFAGCLAVAAATITGVVLAYYFHTGWLPVRSFDPAAWRGVERDDDEARLQMIGSLLRSGRLRGLTRSEVVALLGSPDGGGYFGHYDLVYRLGPERGIIRIDSEWLVVRLGRDGRVSEYRLARD